ncbi:MAG: glycoside hydrolase family 15 protein [Dehalococcoidia bacterium]|nr:glycoside hydrolase family 15 protein [Dehalococcoidia bacterium]
MANSPADRYPPISDYALVGDSRASALISRDGSVDWMCLPKFDSPAVFARMLDWDRGGHFQIVPECAYTARRRYIDATNVLETTFHTDQGDVALIDFMPAQDEAVKREALAPLRMLIRIVEGRSGCVPMRLAYVPRPDYGVGSVRLHGHTPTEVTALRGRHALHLRSDVALDVAPYDARGRFDAKAGERLRFSLAYSHDEPAVIVSDGYVDRLYEETIAFWQDWSSRVDYDGPYRNGVVRSALALKLLSYAPSGAIVAAPTTSLPERIGGARNWDYRYCWIRDAAFTVKAFLSIGLQAEANAFFSWLMHATHQTAPRLGPLYSVLGEPHVSEHEVDHLEGYRGSRPVRIGNAAYNQHQLDVYGELIGAIHAFLEDQDGKVASDEARFISQVADFVADHWPEPDNGIWEARAAPQQYVESKVMAWQALTEAAALDDEGRIKGDAGRWRREADTLRAEVLARGYNREVGAFTQVLDGDALDASVLAMSIVRFIAPDDPRMLSTIDAIKERLGRDGFLKRYTDFDDGVEGDEGTFIFCNFWLACALAQAHRTEEARAVFDQTMTAANDVGLLSEEWEAKTGTALGNFPQGLSHLALITAALAIQHAESGSREQQRQWPSAK